MRLGGPVFYRGSSINEFIEAHIRKGYKNCLCPEFLSLHDKEKIVACKTALKENDIVLSEVGAWCNILSPDKTEAEKNIEYMIERLRLADALEAKTCVNIIGTKSSENWYGPSVECYSESFKKEAIEVIRHIIDSVKPKHTKLSFEAMPYCFLDSPREYVKFLEAVDRQKETAVHLDLCNCINHPRLYYNNTDFIKETFSLVGDQIVSIHLKDIKMATDKLTVMFEEVPIGKGQIDYRTLLSEINKLDADVPVILEHLPTEAEYDEAAAYVRSMLEQVN